MGKWMGGWIDGWGMTYHHVVEGREDLEPALFLRGGLEGDGLGWVGGWVMYDT